MNLKDCYIKFGGDFDEVWVDCAVNKAFRNLCISFWTIKVFFLFEASMENKRLC